MFHCGMTELFNINLGVIQWLLENVKIKIKVLFCQATVLSSGQETRSMSSKWRYLGQVSWPRAGAQ